MARPAHGTPDRDGPYGVRAGRVHVALKVIPGASRTRVVGRLGERLKVAVAAPPERGEANAEVCRLLATCLGVKVSSIHIVAGGSSPQKTASVPFANMADVRRALEPPPTPPSPSPPEGSSP